LEKDIKDQLESSAVITARSSFKVLLEEERIFANSDCFLIEIKEKYLFIPKTSWGDGIE
jgi:hypothetical protein